MRLKTLFVLLAMLAPLAVAQSGNYQDGTYLGFKPVTTGTNLNPITGEIMNSMHRPTSFRPATSSI